MNNENNNYNNEVIKGEEFGLTEQQTLFCKMYVQGHTNKESYLIAYPNSGEKSAESNSSRLLKNKKVIKYINYLLDQMADSCEINDKEIIRELKRMAFGGTNNDMARLKALQMLGTISGLFRKEESKVTNNMITISVEDKEQKQLEDNGNGKIIGCGFEIVDDETNGGE